MPYGALAVIIAFVVCGCDDHSDDLPPGGRELVPGTKLLAAIYCDTGHQIDFAAHCTTPVFISIRHTGGSDAPGTDCHVDPTFCPERESSLRPWGARSRSPAGRSDQSGLKV